MRQDKCLRCGERTRDSALCKLCITELRAQPWTPGQSALSEIVYVGPYTLVRF